MAFEPGAKLSPEDMKFRASIWLESCGDLGDALWSEATMAAIQTSKWMPKPAEFRAFVGDKLATRAKRLKRCRDMLAAVGGDKPAPTAKPFEPEPRVVRLRSMRDSYRKHGYADPAAKVELELAEVEGREPEDWSRVAVDAGFPVSAEKPEATPTRPLSPEQRIALNLALSAKHRAAGRHAWADQLDQQSRDLGYVPTEAWSHNEPPVPDEIPE